MPLAPGTRLGPHEIVALLGAGGMGEVYRARDTALGRDVALKFLPRAFAADADRLARFEREAQALASLNHPNIAQVYAIEPVPAEPGGSPGRAIVMELVEGEDLSVRLTRGAVPLDDALPLARQIALALEAAHNAGIIHRDLKPANIKIRADGTAKVLDFGLAKAVSTDAGAVAPDLANSPTLTARATDLGVVLGTAAYMAPEQAKGRVVDRRADIWAFGVVLYEMLTGRRAFGGDDVTEVMAAVIRDTPDAAALPAATPGAVRRLIKRCLEKDPRKRLRDMGDAGVELDDAMIESAAPALEAYRAPAKARRSLIAFGVAAIVLAGLAAAAAWSLKPEAVVDRPITRFSVVLEEGQRLALNSQNISLSRDGRRLAFRADGVIYVRNLDDVKARELVKAAGVSQWFSPQGDRLLYRTTSGLSTIAVSGGPSTELVAFQDFLGLDWTEDGTIFYSDGKTIKRIRDTGGTPTVIVTAAEGEAISAPQLLPGGRVLLYTAGSSRGSSTTVVRGIVGEPREPKTVLTGAIAARYAPTGHLLFGRDGRMIAVPFDVNRLETIGTAVPLPDRAYVSAAGLLQAAWSDTGHLAYFSGELSQTLRLSWVEPPGPARAAVSVSRNYSDLVLSPDGRRAAVHLWDEDNDVWVADLVRGGLTTRITFAKEEDETPVWSPDGSELAYAGVRDGKRALLVKAVDGGAAAMERKVWVDPDHFHVNDWSKEGAILVEVLRTGRVNDIVVVDVQTGKAKDLLSSSHAEYSARLSSDGKWMAYVSEETGRPEVYVQPYPALNARVSVSTGGGREPVWSHDGRKLYFRSAESVMEAAVTSLAPLDFGTPKVVFRDTYMRTQGTGHTHFDVSADGRFLMIENPNASTIGRQEIHIVLNWFEQLKKIK